MKLTNNEIKNAKPRDKSYKLSDGNGLFLLIATNGSKYWRFKYRFNGKEKLLALGVYNQITLAEARQKRDKARELLANGIDPGKFKQENKRLSKIAAENSFELLAREWHAKFSIKWTPKHSNRILRQFEREVFPWLGNKAIIEITAPEILMALRRAEHRGAIETAHRLHQSCSQVFRYAIATGRAERDPAADLKGAIPPPRKKHYASLTSINDVSQLLNAINGYQGSFPTKCALRLAPLLFVRPGELRKAEWSEFNFDAAEWRIPAEKMKMRVTHIVPLATQAVIILKELQPLTCSKKYVFPCTRNTDRPMSENTVTAALRRLGYTKDEMTGHGFRSMASTLLNEQGWNRDAIERQLAHAERNNIRAAYNYAEYLPERRKMMQHWADYLEKLMSIQIKS